MCYDHCVFVALEELRGCYELRGSWVLDLKPVNLHIIRPLAQCMSCRACEVSACAYATLFMYVQPVRLIPPPTRGGQESSGGLELLTKSDLKKRKKEKRITKHQFRTCFTSKQVQALQVMTPSEVLTFSNLSDFITLNTTSVSACWVSRQRHQWHKHTFNQQPVWRHVATHVIQWPNEDNCIISYVTAITGT